ncbi:Bifunctional protein PyrR [bioreactor metagenome]|uniref:Bifunctional protein PyrR n=1 Tax=bioreactor metagenome TaxID=1076179 RepID=A0A645DH59_9ZZZZ
MEYKHKADIMDSQAINRAVTRIAFEIVEKNKGANDLCFIGIRKGGILLTKKIVSKIEEIEKSRVLTGWLDVTHFRDDNAGKKLPAQNMTEISFDVNDKKIILVDDVLYTGRTVRAAIDAIMEKGRPKNIQLAVLVDRGHRELPIRPDFVGKNVPTSGNEKVLVSMTEDEVNNKVTIVTKAFI